VPVTHPVYPLPPFITKAAPMDSLLDGLSYFPYGYLAAELAYEFLSGARLSPQPPLELCEQNLTYVAQQFDFATNFTLMGIEQKNYTMQRDGVFFLADSLTGVTNLTWQCYQVSLLAEQTLES